MDFVRLIKVELPLYGQIFSGTIVYQINLGEFN